jgi:hypothetical protein
MAFELPGGIELSDVTRVRVLDFPAAGIPSDAVVPLVPVHQGLITIQNRLGIDVTVRLEGPTNHAVVVRRDHSERLRAMPGSYRLTLRHGDAERPTYLRGERFSLVSGGSNQASATIVLGESYQTSSVTAAEFDGDPPVCPPALQEQR